MRMATDKDTPISDEARRFHAVVGLSCHQNDYGPAAKHGYVIRHLSARADRLVAQGDAEQLFEFVRMLR